MTTIQKSVRVRLYSTKEQEVLINKTIGCCRFVHNQTLENCKQSYEQAQIEADAVAYKNQQEELKRKFGDNVPTMDALLDSDGVREQVRSSGIDVDIASRNIRRNILPKSHFDSQEECDDAIVKSLPPEELESRIEKDTDELETMLKSDIPELNKSLDINNYKQKG